MSPRRIARPILRFPRVRQTKNEVSEGRARTPQALVSFPASLTRENMVSTCRRIVLKWRNERKVLEHSRAITPRQLALVRFFILAEQSRFDSPFIELWPSSLPVLIARYRHFSHWLLDNGAREGNAFFVSFCRGRANERFPKDKRAHNERHGSH